jgi:hypothetical protein
MAVKRKNPEIADLPKKVVGNRKASAIKGGIRLEPRDGR